MDIAVQKNKIEIVELLLKQKGIIINTNNEILFHIDKIFFWNLMISSLFIWRRPVDMTKNIAIRKLLKSVMS